MASQLRWLVLVALLVAGAFVGIRELTTEASAPKRVWSAEHGHWHIEGQEDEGAAVPVPVPVPPPDPAPPGKEE